MRLSEFKDGDAIKVIANILPAVARIAAKKEIIGKRDNALEFAAALLKESPNEVMEILAYLDGKKPEEYHCTGATVLVDAFNMISDPDMLALFGVQSKIAASSGSASTTGEAVAVSEGS